MANKRIKDLSTTAAVTASDDFIAVDGATNGTRKLNAYSPTFGGNLTVSGATSTITLGSTNTASIAVDASGGLTVTPKAGQSTYLKATKTTALSTAADFLTVGQVIDDNTTGFAVGVGGGVAFRGKRNTAGDQTVYGAIIGSKLNAGEDDYVGKLTFYTNNNSTGVPLARMTLSGPDLAVVGNLTVSGGTISSGTASLTLKSTASTVILQSAGTTALTLDSSQNATFAGSIAIGNTVAAAVGVASTHKVTISIGGSTYYLLATNV